MNKVRSKYDRRCRTRYLKYENKNTNDVNGNKIKADSELYCRNSEVINTR